MKVSAKGRKFIQEHEGLLLMPYKVGSFEKYWTVGYGHYGPDVKPGVAITIAKARSLLKDDLEATAHTVRVQIDVNLSQEQFDALSSFVYNLGPGALSTSTLRKRLNAGDPKNKVFKEELPKWVNAGGHTLPGLVQRRKDEVRLATKGKYK